MEGSRSNIYVSYNHLQDIGDLDTQNKNIVVAGVERGLNAFQYPNNESPHLHLEILYSADGNLDNAIRINPLLFFDMDTASMIINHAGPYYPVDTINAQARTQFEWPEPDTVDPVEVQQQPFDGVAFNNRNLGHIQEDNVEDMDLGIQYEEYNFWSIVADQQSQVANVCTYVWGRTNQQILFRYASDQFCTTSGTQDLGENENEYDGPEWLTDK